MQVKRVECYEFPTFCAMMQEAIVEGYRFDFESNSRYPTSFGGYYNVELIKESTPEVALKDEKQQDIAENKQSDSQEVVSIDSVLVNTVDHDNFGSTQVKTPVEPTDSPLETLSSEDSTKVAKRGRKASK